MRNTLTFAIFILAVTGLFICNILFGAVKIDPAHVFRALFDSGTAEDINRYILLDNRLPTAVTALLSGAGLGCAGLLLQTVFRNPLAGPSILGISSGASLGVAIVTLFFTSSISIADLEWSGKGAVIAGSFFGSFMILGLLIIAAMRLRNNLTLLIFGMMIGYLSSSIVSLLTSTSTASGIQNFAIWGLGTFSGIGRESLGGFAICITIGLAGSLFLAKPLNLLLLGDNYARNLGVNVNRIRNLLLIVSGVLTAVITAYCGPIAFIGLAIPHIARLFLHTHNHWSLLPAVMLLGGMVCLLCNLMSVTLSSTVIPINALTPIIGVPVIIYVILRRKS